MKLNSEIYNLYCCFLTSQTSFLLVNYTKTIKE
nr:MAG TPA: hypothetical protein [Ackermannviridae sp.]